FGQTGPRAQDGGFDVSVQAASGIMSITGEREGPPLKAGVPVSDMATGVYAAYAIAALLRQVAAGGPGGYVDMTMLGASLGFAAFQTSEYFGNRKDPARHGSAHPRNAPYQGFKAADGHFVVAAGNDKLWQSVCAVMKRPDLAADARFATTALRAKNQVELARLLQVEFERRTVMEWATDFRAAGVPCEPVNSISQAMFSEQVSHAGWVQPLELPNGKKTETVAAPIILNGRSLGAGRRPPALGEHNRQVLAELSKK
ncbi:MAG: CoA transferase, partial [Alphaproteobacteria bacterium]|nr:CoA transferase [Alphaproteobacteria bacterium]